MTAAKKKTIQEGSHIFGAIDVGTSSIRLVIGQTLPKGRWEILERLQRAVRLGQDTFQRGRLRVPTMRSAVAILRDYRGLLDDYGVEQVRAVATSAVREAANGDTFIDRVLMATDIELSPISVAEESRLTVAAVRHSAQEQLKGRKNALIVQVGGGSTLLTVLAKDRITACQSLPIGSIRSQETLATNQERPEKAAKLIKHEVASTLSTLANLLPLDRIRTCVAVGADARWTAATLKRSSSLAGVATIMRSAYDDLLAKCQQSQGGKLTKKYGLSFAEVETLIPSLLILQGILHATQAKKIIIPDVSMIDGQFLDMVQATSQQSDDYTHKQVIESALTTAEKYGCSSKHGLQVMNLATDFFDRFRKEHRLSDRFRLLLQVAALLHEVGAFVASRSHHKHTLYLVAHSEVFGLTQEELLLVANIARYHRRSRPKPSHPEYMSLSREKRMIVNKLAAILRVADALDISRTQQIDKLDARIEGENLIITTAPGGDYTLEKRSLRLKSDLFEDIYGLTVRIDESLSGDLDTIAAELE